jgi:hypothetical protein
MKRLGAALMMVLMVIAVGCYSGTRRPPTYPVTGTVTMKGQPLAGATVVFVPAEGATHEPATGITDAAGHFKLSTFLADDGAQEGEYRVKIAKYDTKAPTKADKEQYLSYEEEQKRSFPTDELPTPPSKNLLAKKYESETTSGLTHTVTKGTNTVELKLE